MTEYHKKTIAKQMASLAYWKEPPMKPEEYFAQFMRLREQRLARQSRQSDISSV